jgi:lipopolysaccharide biosynthesis glycosyltransferase
VEKRLIFTIVAGDFHRFLAKLTHPQMQKYAEQVKADFKVVEIPDDKSSSCCWEKYRIIKFLREYERVLYLDTDVFIKDGAEDIFEYVPRETFGAFNEIPHMKEFVNMIYEAFLREIGVVGEEAARYLDAPYFNAGVMLASRGHENAFLYPGHPAAYEHDWDYYGDQATANYNVSRFKVPYFDITARFNLMMGNESAQMNKSVPMKDCSFFHFAGAFKQQELKNGGTYAMAETRIADLKAKLKGRN